jgi:hypothetical protein
MDQSQFIKTLNKIDNWDTTELEIRYTRVTPDFLRNVIEDIRTDYTFSQSISFIKRLQQDEYLVNKITFNKDNKINENYIKKDLGFYFDNTKKIALSSEIPSDRKVDINNIDNLIVRYKYRMSYKPGNGWVYDLTLVHNFNNLENPSVFNNVKNQLYINEPNKDHFIKLIDNKLINKYEIEIEYESKENIPSDEFINIKELEKKIPSLIEYNNYVLIVNQIASIFGKKYTSFKTLLPQAVTLTSVSYNSIYPPINWYLTHKTDGYRGLAYIKNNMIVIICAQYFKIYYCKNRVCKKKNVLNQKGEIPTDNDDEKQDSLYIVDCEIIDNNIYIFDIIVYESIDVTKENFSRRHILLEKLGPVLSSYNSELNIKVKFFRKITEDLQRSFKDIIDYKPEYEYDGYMLIDSVNNYTNTKSYKIKTHNTIDFYVYKCPDEFLDKFNFIKKKGYILYILYLTLNKNDLNKYKIKSLPVTLKYLKTPSITIPMHFSPNDYPNAYLYYSKKDLGMYTIAEMNPKFNENGFQEWELIKIREDKLLEQNYYGNYYSLAEEMWYANQNPLYINKMYMPSSSYFMISKSSIYYAQTGFNSYVKECLIKENNNNRAVCDLACGKGQDLGRYLKYGYNNIMLVEVDKNAISELIIRLPNLISKYVNKKSMLGKNNIRIVNTNLHNDYLSVLDKMYAITSLKSYSLVVCNLAIHYIINTDKNMYNFMSLIDNLVEPGGMFIYTTNNNKAIHEKFISLESDTIELYENDTLKYMIKKNYKESTLDENLFQTVDWKLLFNNELVTEPLMPHNKFNTLMKSHKFEVYKEGSFSDYITDKTELSDIDKEYVGFYYYCILKKEI